MSRILLTAFEPFGGDVVNPSLEILRRLSSLPNVDALTVPVTFRDAAAAVLPHLPGHDAVLMLGQAKGRDGLTVERIAINIDDAALPDNAGEQLRDRPILSDGAAAYFATLPIKSIVDAIRAEGLPAAVSNTAGTFVCNHLMYCVLHALEGSATRAGFIHVPCLPEQTAGHPGMPSMPLSDMIRGIEAVLKIL